MKTQGFTMYSAKVDNVSGSGVLGAFDGEPRKLSEVTIVLNNADNEEVKIRMKRDQLDIMIKLCQELINNPTFNTPVYPSK